MVPDLFDHAVDDISKNPMAFLKEQINSVLSKEKIEMISESRWQSLLDRFLRQLHLHASDQPSSPLDTTISEGSQKSEDGLFSVDDEPAQPRDTVKRLPATMEDVRALYL